MKAEQVRLGDVRNSSPYYLDDPFLHKNTQVYYAGLEDHPADTLVWTVFESWSRYNPWLKKEVNGPLGILTNGLTNSLTGLDEALR